MITITKASSPYRRCNVCHSQSNVAEINFSDEHFGTEVAICRECMDKLHMITGYAADPYDDYYQLTFSEDGLIERKRIAETRGEKL